MTEAVPVQETPEPKQAVSGNTMRTVRIAKVTLNIGAGKNEDMLKKGITLMKKLSSVEPVKTSTSKRIPGWGLRPGLQIGCKVTVRKGAQELLQRLLAAKAHTLPAKAFDAHGNFSFGVPEYIDIEGLEYDPDLKIIGLEVAVTLERPGYRIKKRKIRKAKLGKNHAVTKEDAIAFARDTLGVTVEE